MTNAQLDAARVSAAGIERRREGSNASRMRVVRSATTASTCRRLRLGVVHHTHAHLGDERARERRDLGRRDRPAVRRQLGRPLQEDPRGLAVPEHARRWNPAR